MDSKAWAWEIVDMTAWQSPCRIYYYYQQRWKDKGYRNILDLGCGLGRHAIAFSRAGFTVTACDLSEFAVEKARQRAHSLGINDITFDICDMLELPYSNKSFDAIFAYHVISHTDSMGIVKILQQLNKILCDDGEIYIDFLSKDSMQYIRATNRVDDNTIIMEEIAEEYGIPHYFVELDEIAGLMQDFEILDITKRAKYNFLTEEYMGDYYYVHAKKR